MPHVPKSGSNWAVEDLGQCYFVALQCCTPAGKLTALNGGLGRQHQGGRRGKAVDPVQLMSTTTAIILIMFTGNSKPPASQACQRARLGGCIHVLGPY